MNKDWKLHRRKNIIELRPYIPGEDLGPNVVITEYDKKQGSPKKGDMIARDPENKDDAWLVNEEFYYKNYEPISIRLTKENLKEILNK